MTDLLTAEQMRGIERAAIDSGEVSGAELMERAGEGVMAAIFGRWPALAAAPHHAVILCGPGNNGGDGFVLARLLKGQGWRIDLYLLDDPGKLPPDARTNHDRWSELGPVTPLASAKIAAEVDLVVDALFGTGLTRGLDGVAKKAVAMLAEHPARIVAVDAPSGLCMDSGRPLGAVAPADLTVTFHVEKCGHRLAEGPQMCGAVAVADIGLSRIAAAREARGGLSPARLAVRENAVPGLGKAHGHKYAHGHAVIVAGPPSRGGAARMAARGALRVGAGLVTLACPRAAEPENAARLDAIMLRGFDETGGLVELLADARINALCIGPGIGHDDTALALVTAVLGAGRATVVDADALTLFEDTPQALFDQLHDACVLTPHGGEFARLFPDLAERLEGRPETGPGFSKLDAARQAAARAGCTVLFKGPDTVIAAPDGAASVASAAYDRAVPWLATAGAGDVLSGLITGLLARGLAPHPAAEMAAWLHVEAARSFGAGLIAEDLPEELPRVFRALGL